MIIYLAQLAPDARVACAPRGATVPGDLAPNFSGADGPAVHPLFRLAPHGVFPAARIAPRAVSFYLAISPSPNERFHARRAVYFL